MPTSASSGHPGETDEMVKMIQTRADPADQGSGMGQSLSFYRGAVEEGSDWASKSEINLSNNQKKP